MDGVTSPTRREGRRETIGFGSRSASLGSSGRSPTLPPTQFQDAGEAVVSTVQLAQCPGCRGESSRRGVRKNTALPLDDRS
jgi:hypothetical protein